MTKQLKINPAPGSSAVRGAEWGAPQVSFPVFLSDSLRIYPWLPPTCWAWGQSDPQLVPVPPKIKARHTDYKVVQVGGGREGAKGTRVVGEMGGGGRLGRRHPGGDPGSPGPQSVPPTQAFGLCLEIGPPGAPGGAVRALSAVAAAGQSREPRGTARARGAPTSPRRRDPPAASGPRSPRPADRRAGEKENQPTEGAPQLPRVSGTRAPSSRPGDNGKEGEKRVKKLG